MGLLELQAGRLASVKRLRAADRARLTEAAAETPQRPVSLGRAGPADSGRTARTGKVLVRITDADLYVDYRAVLRQVTWELRRGENVR